MRGSTSPWSEALVGQYYTWFISSISKCTPTPTIMFFPSASSSTLFVYSFVNKCRGRGYAPTSVYTFTSRGCVPCLAITSGVSKPLSDQKVVQDIYWQPILHGSYTTDMCNVISAGMFVNTYAPVCAFSMCVCV